MTTTAPRRVAPSGAIIAPPKRRSDRLSLLGVPVTALAGIELLAICALLVAESRVIVTLIAIAVGVVIVIVALLRRRDIRVGTWILLRIGYLLRQRDTLVAETGHLGGRGGSAATDPGRSQSHVAPEIEAFFPGMSVRESRMHDGESMGVVQWHGKFAATLQIATPSGIVRSRNNTDIVPLPAIFGALDGHDELGLDSVQVLTQTILGEPDVRLTPLLASAGAELAAGQPLLRNRTTFVTVRLDPSTAAAAAAIAARRGGHTGAGRVLSVALSRIRAALTECGMEVTILDGSNAVRAIAESWYHQATPYDPLIRWTERVGHIASNRMAHRSFLLTDMRRPALADVPIGGVFAYALGSQAEAMPGGGWSTRTVLRLTCRSTGSLDHASRELRSAARRRGITLRPLDAMQHLGMRATVPIGGI